MSLSHNLGAGLITENLILEKRQTVSAEVIRWFRARLAPHPVRERRRICYPVQLSRQNAGFPLPLRGSMVGCPVPSPVEGNIGMSRNIANFADPRKCNNVANFTQSAYATVKLKCIGPSEARPKSSP